MTIYSISQRCVISIVMLLSIFSAQITHAQTSCGYFITTEDGQVFQEPIDDCNTPFGPLNPNPDIQVSFNGTPIEDGGIYPLAGTSGTLSIADIGPFSIARLYKKEDTNYILAGYSLDTITFATGTYALYIPEEGIPVLSSTQTPIQQLFAYILPTAYAAPGNTTLITFTVTEPTPEPPPVDPLILQYAPILYFHPQEDYFPMDVNTFIEASSLWKINPTGDDVLLKSATDLTFKVFESIVDTGINTDDMYLAFSSPDTPRTVDLQRAKSTYAAMDQSTPTIYYHKMTDTTDYGKTFTVLQYWYFYAMNNWKEQVGGTFTNNHEGDWESTFIFLNDETKEPEYVAYSAHLNDGLPQYLNGQYDSVRRDWGSADVAKDGNRVKNYVAVGSHANYFNVGAYEILRDIGPIEGSVDYTSEDGDLLIVKQDNLRRIENNIWTQYQYLWGTFTNKNGFNGPQGPTHINVTGQTRFSEPIEWAGLNNFFKVVVNTTTDTVEDTKQGIKMVFDILLDIGTNIVAERYNEYITFGANIAEFNPLPFFIDITSDTDTSGLTMTLSYDPDYLESTGQLAEDLVILYYNPATDLLEALESVVNLEDNTVTAYTPHLSRYLLGFQEKEQSQPTTSTTSSSTITTTATDSIREHNYGRRIMRQPAPTPAVLGVATTVKEEQFAQLERLVDSIEVLIQKRNFLNEEQRKELHEVLGDVLELLESIRQSSL